MGKLDPQPFFINSNKMNGNIVDMCNYVALINTDEAISLCENYNYKVDEESPEHISETMIEICAENGKGALKKILEIHPDRQAILDAFNQRTPQAKFNACGGCQGAVNPALSRYNGYQSFYATGDNASNSNTNNQNTFANMISMQTNTILVLGLLVVGGAILYKNLK